MTDENPSILSHVSVGTNDAKAAHGFYDAVFQTLGIGRMMEHGDAVGYGRVFPEFWVHPPHDGKPASVGNGVHISFLADSPAAVDAFHAAATAAGGTNDGAPGPRPEYSDAYYGCFVRDLDGHKIEAMFWDETKI